ncbi:sigma-54-dependent Fis family transcriptional re gulator [Desulfonema ishimotonii]|uniref:Sigma-54-dependent Fis family transcriptional re gulator n=1 Tax=Desulfonema ishimotonii TaxID=45657 RepID=A0A401FZN2_9BACT|nr:sigma-54 dependent transcriptional regulator [Desulfonema ishimotonii]GBC62439.1 sigma-54-dependent Fis family transcriptional re gulator [Desulfonema ishimotonii]
MSSVLVVSAEREVVQVIRSAFGPDAGVAHVANRYSALEILQRKRRDFVFIDISILREMSSHKDFKEALRPFWNLFPSIEIIVMAPREMIRQAVRAVKAGATDYLTYPIVPDEARLVAESIRESVLMESELEYLRNQQWKSDSFEFVKTRNAGMQQVFSKIRSVAPTKTTVLLAGETGVGKGVLARLIHRHSNREDAQFISVHCGAIPETLVESELFGHERGAFTGAIRKRLGKFEIAKDGTIFLDEIGTVTPQVQIRLLQVLQDGIFSRVGGEDVIATTARVIAATNTDLRQMSETGLFRKDLYYRLNVFPIEIPPLRERPEDIPFFTDFFLGKMNRLNPKSIHDIHPKVLEALARYSWPGNIRELENLIERAYILETSSVLTPESFPAELFEQEGTTSLPVNVSLPLAEARQQVVASFERQYLKELLSQYQGRVNRTAEAAGITTRQLHKLMRKYGLRKEDFKA